MTLARNAGVWATSPADARTTRRSLRAEKAQLIRWRRLVRARLDLTVAAFAPPTALGAATRATLPAPMGGLPLPQELADAIALTPPTDPVELMAHLRSLDRMLAAYGAQLDTALECSTDDDPPHGAAAGSVRTAATVPEL